MFRLAALKKLHGHSTLGIDIGLHIKKIDSVIIFEKSAEKDAFFKKYVALAKETLKEKRSMKKKRFMYFIAMLKCAELLKAFFGEPRTIAPIEVFCFSRKDKLW